MKELLTVDDLRVSFDTPEGILPAVSGVSFSLKKGEILGVLGESASGKTQIFLALMGLLSRNGQSSGSVKLDGEEILNIPADRINRIRGSKISMIFQDPMSSLNPYLKISRQMMEVLQTHQGMNRYQAYQFCLRTLTQLGLSEPSSLMKMYPHELSGGMRQRIMIGIALLCSPKIMIADEPTTALDVTIQAQILSLMKEINRALNTSIILISHDFGVIASMCERAVIMYAGKIVEKGRVEDLFLRPEHPYTAGLIRSIPLLDSNLDQKLFYLKGNPPHLLNLSPGCAFKPRCQYAESICTQEQPQLRRVKANHYKSCHLKTCPKNF